MPNLPHKQWKNLPLADSAHPNHVFHPMLFFFNAIKKKKSLPKAFMIFGFPSLIVIIDIHFCNSNPRTEEKEEEKTRV